MSEYTFKNLNTIDTKAEPADGTTVMGFENGVPIQMPMKAVKSGGGVFIIDTSSNSYKPTDPVYGDEVKEAILTGKSVWIYNDNTYNAVKQMSIGSNCGQSIIWLYYGSSTEFISLYISDIY